MEARHGAPQQSNGTLVSQQSNASNKSRPRSQSILTHLRTSRKVLQSGLPRSFASFPSRIDKATNGRFADFLAVVNEPLTTYMRNKYPKCSVLLRLMALGKDHDSAEFYIIVSCDKDTISRAQKFFEKEDIKHLASSNDPTQAPFKFWYYSGSIQLRAGDTAEVLGSLPDHSPTIRTSCGTLIQLTAGERTAYATMGGLLSVITDDCPFIFGLTAGHFLRNDTLDLTKRDSVQSTAYSDDESKESDISRYTWEDGHSAPSPSPSLMEMDYEDLGAGKPWAKLGSIASISSSVRALNRDWALIEHIDPRFVRCNRFAENDTDVIHRDIGRAEAICATGQQLEAVVISNDDTRKGLLWTSPAAVLLPAGQSLVEVYTLSLHDINGIPTGSSGSWVLNPNTLGVYGHVVAEDPFGDVLIVPLCDIIDDIKEELHATNVEMINENHIFRQSLGMNPESPDPRTSELETPDVDVEQLKTPNRSKDERISIAGFRRQSSPRLSVTSSGEVIRDSGLAMERGYPLYPSPTHKPDFSNPTGVHREGWYCCKCGEGCHSVILDQSCPHCHNARCSACKIQDLGVGRIGDEDV